MLRKIVAVATAGVISCTAVAQTFVPAMLMPSPIGVALTVGTWLYGLQPREKVYYIQVEARAATESEARQEAFRVAIEHAIGSLVLSERVVSNQSVQRNELINYSSGFIDKYKILNVQQQDDGVTVKMDVWVKGSQIADRLLNSSVDSREVNGEQVHEQVQSLQHERQQSDRVLSSVLNDYPERAFDIKTNKVSTRFNDYRQLELAVPVEIKWNPTYINSLWETFERISQNPRAGACNSVQNCHYNFTVTMQGKTDSWLFNHWGGTFGFNDPTKRIIMINKMLGTRPSVLLTLRDGFGRAVHQSCYNWAELDGHVRYQYPAKQFVAIRDNNAIIDATFTLKGVINVAVANIAVVNSVDLAVVRESQCPKHN